MSGQTERERERDTFFDLPLSPHRVREAAMSAIQQLCIQLTLSAQSLLTADM